MEFEILFHDEADMEYFESFIWYEKQQAGLGEKFLNQIENIFDRIQKNPEHYPSKRKNYREAVVSIFPFVIVYQVFRNDSLIYISSVYHGSRNPKTKYRKKV